MSSPEASSISTISPAACRRWPSAPPIPTARSISSGNHNSPGLRNAERGILEITDGGPKIEHSLTPELLRTGSYVYVRRSDDVNLRLTVYRKNETPVSEGSRFLGQPTSRAFASEIGRLVVERNQLRTEKEAATKKLEAEQARTKLLQQQVRLLQQQVDTLRNQAAAR